MENVIVFDHPLIQHKISILRKKSKLRQMNSRFDQKRSPC